MTSYLGLCALNTKRNGGMWKCLKRNRFFSLHMCRERYSYKHKHYLTEPFYEVFSNSGKRLLSTLNKTEAEDYYSILTEEAKLVCVS